MSKGRIAAGLLTLSAVAFVGRMVQEGWSETAKIPVKGDKPTLGFGMTWRPDGTPVQIGDRTNPVEALQRSMVHAQRDESGLKKCVTAPLYQAEFDMLMDHAYQYGVPATCKSSMVRLSNQQRYAEACEAHLEWKKMRVRAGAPHYDCSTPGNKVCGGVWKDAQRRHKLCVEAAR